MNKWIKVLILCVIAPVCFNADATYYTTKTKKYYSPGKAGIILKKDVAKLKAELAKAEKAGDKDLVAAYQDAIKAKMKEADGYRTGSRAKVKSGEGMYGDAMDKIAKLKEKTKVSPEEAKAELREDAKDNLQAAKYKRLAATAAANAVKFKNKGMTDLAAKLADKAEKFNKLSEAYRTGDVKAIDAISIELGHKKAPAKK